MVVPHCTGLLPGGHAAVVEALLGAGAELHAVDQTKWVALDHAIENGHLDVC